MLSISIFIAHYKLIRNIDSNLLITAMLQRYDYMLKNNT